MDKERKSLIIRSLYSFKNSYALKSINVLIDAGYKYVRLIHTAQKTDGNNQLFNLKDISESGLEFLMGLHEKEISFSPTTDYPQLKVDYLGVNVDIDFNHIDYTTVYTIVGKARPHAPEFFINGLIVFHGEYVDVFLPKETVKNISVITDQELLHKAKQFSSITGSQRGFDYDKFNSLCTTSFKIYRQSSLAGTNEKLTGTYTLEDFIELGKAVRQTHENITFANDNDLRQMRWEWCPDGDLWAKGTVKARYTGTMPEDPIALKADPFLESLLSDDGKYKDISYNFEYCFKFNVFGRIESLTIYRDEERMNRCYSLNSSDIDSILQLATQTARRKDRTDLAENITLMSKALLEKEQEGLALTTLLGKIEKASPEQKEYLIEALGDAMYKVAKSHY